jgi:hypothetical protein
LSENDNPREIIGGNFPPLARSIAAEEGDFALVTTAFLEEEYAKQGPIVTALLDEARDVPKVIEDADTKAKVASIIKRMRDQAKLLAAAHSKEKQPYLRGGQAVDQFFFGLVDKLTRRAKTNNPGAADVLNNRLTDYDNRVLAAEQAKRQREADEAARLARLAQQKAAEEAAAAEAARLAAERARKPETVAEKTTVAVAQEQVADQAKVEAVVTTAQAHEAHIATLAKPADIMRTRGEDGTLSTMGTEKYAEIVDRTLLDKEKLWPYIKQDAIASALTQWSKFTDYNQQMPGAAIGRRNRSVVR